MASYEDSEIYKLGKRLAVEIHAMTLDELPKYEMYEEGSQVRRSSKSIIATYVEGYGRRIYKAEYAKFLTYSLASNDETKAHLDLLHETKLLSPDRFQYFMTGYRQLGRMLYNLRKSLMEGRAS